MGRRGIQLCLRMLQLKISDSDGIGKEEQNQYVWS